jgi:hypothetical protein
MACKLRPDLPQQLMKFKEENVHLPICRSLELMVFQSLAESLEPHGRKEFANLVSCRQWADRMERSERVLEQVMLHTELSENAL